MNVFIIGGAGFIGRRLVRHLTAQGHDVTCMDADPSAHSFADLGGRVTSLRGGVGSFDDVMAAMAAARPERVVNLAYLIGSSHPPHAALRVNVLGMGTASRRPASWGCATRSMPAPMPPTARRPTMAPTTGSVR